MGKEVFEPGRGRARMNVMPTLPWYPSQILSRLDELWHTWRQELVVDSEVDWQTVIVTTGMKSTHVYKLKNT
jgi:hypothetical protein